MSPRLPLPELPDRGRRRRNRRRATRRHKQKLALIAISLIALVVVVLPAGGAGSAAVMCANVDLDQLRPVEIGENSFVYAVDNSLLGSIPAERNRQPMPASRISKWMPAATVAIEDRRFYHHSGVDVEGIARAAVKNLSEKRVVEGGSTITQQLVRNLYISRERTLERKLKEACLAIKLDRAWSKQRILTGYMNQVYYGNHAYGVEAAARTYFSVPARALRIEQAALLAGLTQAPTTYDPFLHPERAIARRDEVLRAMFQTGAITTSSRTSTTSSSRSTAAQPCARVGCASTRPSTASCRSPRDARSRRRFRTRPTRRPRSCRSIPVTVRSARWSQ